jgi:hypothetical protein
MGQVHRLKFCYFTRQDIQKELLKTMLLLITMIAVTSKSLLLHVMLGHRPFLGA